MCQSKRVEMFYNDFLDFKPLEENKIFNWKNESDEKNIN